MRIKDGFVLRNVAGTYIVLDLKNASVELNGMLSLNATGAVLWQVLEHGADVKDLVNTLVKEYNVSNEKAKQDVEEYVDKLLELGCIEK